MPRKQEDEMMAWKEHRGKHKMWMGIGVFLFGLILYWTFQTYQTLRWDIAFMAMGVLIVLKAFLMKSM